MAKRGLGVDGRGLWIVPHPLQPVLCGGADFFAGVGGEGDKGFLEGGGFFGGEEAEPGVAVACEEFKEFLSKSFGVLVVPVDLEGSGGTVAGLGVGVFEFRRGVLENEEKFALGGGGVREQGGEDFQGLVDGEAVEHADGGLGVGGEREANGGGRVGNQGQAAGLGEAGGGGERGADGFVGIGGEVFLDVGVLGV